MKFDFTTTIQGEEVKVNMECTLEEMVGSYELFKKMTKDLPEILADIKKSADYVKSVTPDVLVNIKKSADYIESVTSKKNKEVVNKEYKFATKNLPKALEVVEKYKDLNIDLNIKDDTAYLHLTCTEKEYSDILNEF